MALSCAVSGLFVAATGVAFAELSPGHLFPHLSWPVLAGGSCDSVPSEIRQ